MVLRFLAIFALSLLLAAPVAAQSEHERAVAALSAESRPRAWRLKRTWSPGSPSSSTASATRS